MSGSRRSLTSRFQKLLGLETKGALATPEPWLLELFGSTPASSGIDVTPRTAMTCAPVRRAVQLISESIGQLPIHIYERGSDSATVTGRIAQCAMAQEAQMRGAKCLRQASA